MWEWFKRLFRKNTPVNPPVANDVIVKPTPSAEPSKSIIPTGVIIKESMKPELKRTVEAIMKNKDRYVAVENNTGVPWMLIAGIHYRESSLSFSGVLHNGERILGTGRKTKLVPAGRGPFSTWEEAAYDALLIKKSIYPKVWTDEEVLRFAEKFNGLGYQRRGIASPYVWGGTSKYTSGHYVADGKFDSSAIDKRLGVAVIIEGLRNS